jgi:hypothetical protein
MPDTTFTVSSVVEGILFLSTMDGQRGLSDIMEDAENTEAKSVKKNMTLVEPHYLKSYGRYVKS